MKEEKRKFLPKIGEVVIAYLGPIATIVFCFSPRSSYLAKTQRLALLGVSRCLSTGVVRHTRAIRSKGWGVTQMAALTEVITVTLSG
jgi:hypothetical protein